MPPTGSRTSRYESLPSVDRVLRVSGIEDLLRSNERDAVVRAIRLAVERARRAIDAGGVSPGLREVAEEVVLWIGALAEPEPQPLINASGVVLHTNLGRAPLGPEAIAAMQAAATGYSDLEYDTRQGTRGSRQTHVEELLKVLTGAEAAHVVVNNAAAMLVALSALTKGREVLVSRGQAVEIGGGFRVPEILRQSGARLVEVGTTNRTRIEDFEEAITERTAAILHVHASNFRLVGFTEEVPLGQLARLAHQRGLRLLDDNGSGALLDTARFGLRHEPTPVESLQSGVDVVAFSGDKLLGGPQAGILLGSQSEIERIRRHPLARAFRPDKLVMAALSATLGVYLRGSAVSSLPVWQMISRPEEELAVRAERFREDAASFGIRVRLESGESTIGGGSLPGETLPTRLIVLPAGITVRALRTGKPPIVTRSRGNRAVLDLRTVADNEERVILDALRKLAAGTRDT